MTGEIAWIIWGIRLFTSKRLEQGAMISEIPIDDGSAATFEAIEEICIFLFKQYN